MHCMRATHFSCFSLFCYAVLSIISSCVIILTRSRALAAMLVLPSRCFEAVNRLWHFLTHSGKSATIRESNHGWGVCKEHYA